MRLIIVKLSSIGDVVHTLPAAALLKRSLPGISLTWIVERRAAEILNDSPAIDRIIEIDTRAWRKNLLSGSTLNDMRAQLHNIGNSSGSNGAAKADIAIDFQGLVKSGLVALATRAPSRIGFETRDLREKASKILLTEQVKTSFFSHVIEKNLALARAAILRVDTKSTVVQDAGSNDGYEFPISVGPHDEHIVEEAVEGRRPYAILNPGGGWPTKLWPPEHYARLADWLNDQFGFQSVVTFGPGEEFLAAKVAENSRSGAVHLLPSSLKQFVALARRAELFVGGDTGPLHLAAASGTPIVGLYGPTSPSRNGPFNPSDVTVGRDLWCRSDCHRRSCWHWECMDISVEDVTSAVSRRLASKKED